MMEQYSKVLPFILSKLHNVYKVKIFNLNISLIEIQCVIDPEVFP